MYIKEGDDVNKKKTCNVMNNIAWKKKRKV